MQGENKMRLGYLSDVDTMISRKMKHNIELRKKQQAGDLTQGEKYMLQVKHKNSLQLPELSQSVLKSSMSAARSPQKTIFDKQYLSRIRKFLQGKLN